MESLIQTYLPNVYKMGWAGQAGWGTAIYLTLYMTVLSFIIGGFLGLVAGLFLVLTAPGGVLENKVVFWILDKITSIFRAVPFIILLAVLSPFSHLIVGTSGATFWDIVGVYLSEGLPDLIRVTTVTLISLVGETAMAGAVGAGGIGNVAIAYGFNRYNHDVTILATIIIILIIFAIQFLGDFLTKKLSHK